MKIYFTGAHATGKSTLARYVSEHFQLPFLNEVARTILAERELRIDSLRSDLALVNSYQEEIFFRQIAEEKKYSAFVSDRSFDCLAYAAQHSTSLSKLMKTAACAEYITQLHAKNVKIFLVRPSRATLKNDGVREELIWDEIVSIDAMIKFMLEMWELKYYQIRTDNMQERIRLVTAVLDKN